jgi:type I restriction enzyme S subunit
VSKQPRGWERSTLGEIGVYLNGRGFKKSEWSDIGRPIIRIQNLTGSSESFNYYDGEADDRHTVRDGDLLVSWAATLGVYLWSGPDAVLNQHIFKVESHVHLPFHRYLLANALADLQRHTHGSGMVHITKGRFDATPVSVPPTREQERIVAAIEEHLSRLDATVAATDSATRRLRVLEKLIITEASSTLAPPSDWRAVTVGDAGSVSLGLQRSPKRHSGPSMRPYLRVANVFEDRIDGGDVMTMDMTDAEWARFRLRDGDVLLNEGQSPEYLGRPAIYRGEPPDVAFTNSLIRFQANEGVDPEWALLVFRSHMHNRRFMRESQITTNIAHLAAGRLKTVEFPLPPLDEQRARVADARKGLEACARLRIEVTRAKKRSAALRRSILAAAFAGNLVPQDPDDEPASALLARIRAERESNPPVRRARRGVRGSVS